MTPGFCKAWKKMLAGHCAHNTHLEHCYANKFYSFGQFFAHRNECGQPTARLSEEFTHAGFPCWTPEKWYPLKKRLEEAERGRLLSARRLYRGSRYQHRGPRFAFYRSLP